MKLLAFFVLMALVTSVFWVTDLDIQVAQYFYHPEHQDAWFEGDYFLWDLFYQLGPVISITIAVGSIFIIMLSGLRKQWNHLRIKAVFILICFVVGPGLIVNALFKDHWGRPRPAQVMALGGSEAYVPPLMFNASGNGKSFPSGHSSVGFALIAFYFLFRKKHLVLARLALALSLVIGSFLGAARIAAGGHFLSDVFWSLWIPLLSSMGLYYFFFHKALNNDEQQSQQNIWKNILYSLVAFAILAYGLFNWPIQQNSHFQISASPNIVFIADKTNLTIQYGEKEDEKIMVHHQVNGFGLPFSKQVVHNEMKKNTPADILSINLASQGFFSELESKLTIKIPPHVHIKNIDIQITDGKLVSAPSLIPLLEK